MKYFIIFVFMLAGCSSGPRFSKNKTRSQVSAADRQYCLHRGDYNHCMIERGYVGD